MEPPTLPAARMVLHVQVLPLAAENAHGRSRVQAIADMKERKFALPVQLNHTFGQVWTLVEERYKRNYLDPQQAAAFTINKLQDAYDCDLDVGDTVGSIFEGETDRAMCTIKVVPCFASRDFSVPVTSNLRPASAQKRIRDMAVERESKRQRIGHAQLQAIREESTSLRDQPVPTTESQPSVGDTPDEAANGLQATNRSSRSHTGGSLVLVNGSQTGNAEFGPGIKEESPELGLPPRQPTIEMQSVEPDVRQPAVPAQKKTTRGSRSQKAKPPPRTPRRPRPKQPPSKTPRQLASQQSWPRTLRQLAPKPLEVQAQAPVPEDNVQPVEADVTQPVEEDITQPVQEDITQPVQEDITQPVQEDITRQDHAQPQPEDEPEPQPQPAFDKASGHTTLRSPKSTPGHSQQIPPLVPAAQTGIYDISSSPEFVPEGPKRNTRTYVRPPKAVQKEADLIKGSLRPSAQAQKDSPIESRSSNTLLEKAIAFQRPQNDEIESTPQEEKALEESRTLQNGASTPDKATPAETPKPGSLKKPSRKLLSAIKAAKDTAASSSQRSIVTPKSTAIRKNIDLAVQVRLNTPRLKRKPPQVMNEQPSRRVSLQPNASAQFAAAADLPTIPAEETITVSATPAEKSILTEKAAPVEAQAETPSVARLSAQSSVSRATPRKIPVPLPANMRNSLSKSGSIQSNSNANDAEAFKEPVPKNQNSASEDVDGHPPQRQNRSFPRFSAQSEAVQITNLVATPVPAPSVSKRRGRLLTNLVAESAAAPKPIAKPSIVESSRTESVKPSAPKRSSQAEFARHDPILISSAEPSSTDDSDEDKVSPDVSGPTANGAAHEEPQPEAGDVDDVDDQLRAASRDGRKSLGLNGVSRPLGGDEEIREPASPPAEVEESPGQIQKAHETTKPWNSFCWNFWNGGLKGETPKEPLSNQEANERTMSSSQALSNGKEENTPDAGPAREEEEGNSRPVSPAVSKRSSPAVTRRPARFLSHSPTPEGSDAEEDDSEEPSAPPSKATTPQVTNNVEDPESDNDSEIVSEASDTEMQDTPTIAPAPQSSKHNLRSSPPQPIAPPAPPPKFTPIVPETSQPAPTPTSSQAYSKTPIPLPPSSQIPSTATPSGPSLRKPTATTAARTALRRPALRTPARQFPGLADQLEMAKGLRKAKSAGVGAFDPRTTRLGKLVGKGVRGKSGKSGKGVGDGGGGESESSEESISESSSDSE